MISTIFVHFMPFFRMGKGRSWGQKEALTGDPMPGQEISGIWDWGFVFEIGFSPWPASPHSTQG